MNQETKKFELPALPYDYAALEPHIDARTMEIHHSKHHQAYIDKLNAALEGQPGLAGKTLFIPRPIRIVRCSNPVNPY